MVLGISAYIILIVILIIWLKKLHAAKFHSAEDGGGATCPESIESRTEADAPVSKDPAIRNPEESGWPGTDGQSAPTSGKRGVE